MCIRDSSDSDEFKALLEFANQFPDTYDWENATDEENDSAQNRINSGKQLMTDMYVSSFEDMLYQLTGFNGGVKFVGYPSEDGTSNHAFQIDGAIAISSTCAPLCAAPTTSMSACAPRVSQRSSRSSSKSSAISIFIISSPVLHIFGQKHEEGCSPPRLALHPQTAHMRPHNLSLIHI